MNKVKLIAQNLEKSQKVNGYDYGDEKEAWTLAHGLVDIEESALILINKLIPKLAVEYCSDDEVEEILLEIGEELRHILYHINDNNYFEYIRNN